jgi:O-antigen/teichoic acid export membrane protein
MANRASKLLEDIGQRNVPSAASSLIRRLQAIAAQSTTGFAKKVAVLSSGTVIAQAINFLLVPVITRLYLPVSIGQVALFTSFLSMAAVAVSLRYELGIVSAPDEREASQLAFLSILFSIPFSLIISALLFALIRFSLFGFGALPQYAALIMIPVLLSTGAFGSLRYWEIRRERYAVVSRSAVVQHGARSALQVVIGFVRAGAAGLLLGELLGRCMGMGTMFRDAFPIVRPHITQTTVDEFRNTLKKNRKFPVYSLPSSFIDTLSMNISVPLLVVLYGSGVAGHFAIVQRVMAIPMSLLTIGVADVFHSSMAQHARANPQLCTALFRKTAFGLLLIGVIPAGLLFFKGESLFSVVFGSRWVLAGTLASAVAPWFLMQFVVSPLSRVVLVFQGQEFKLIYDLLTVVSIALVFGIAKQKALPVLQTVRWLSAVNTVAYAAYFFVLVYVLSRNCQKVETAIGEESPIST